jgi:hypothetical protein
MEEALLPAVYNDPATPLRAVAVAMEAVYVADKGDGAVEHVMNLRRHSTDKFIYHGVKFFFR